MTLAKSLQSAAGNAAADANYIEDVFSTYLYTGTGAAQTITNGIDLAGEGGALWVKRRNGGSGTWSDHWIFDSVRGDSNGIRPNLTNANFNIAPDNFGFSSTGFTVPNYIPFNESGTNYTSWTFRKQEKFFDVVTWVGNGSYPRNIAHNLGSVPGCIIVKNVTSSPTNWLVYHNNMGPAQVAYLNLTNGFATSTSVWNATSPTSTQFTVGSSLGNANGETYVAYLFAHNAGGFGESGEDNVISCGSFLTDPSTGGATVNLGYEPQFLLVKSATSVQGWHLIDNMRGMANSGGYGTAASLEPNSSNAESVGANCFPTANGFWYARSGNTTYIYIAIRRGPMKVPESGTSVFAATTIANSVTAGTIITTGFRTDLQLANYRNGGVTNNTAFTDRLRGISNTGTGSPVMGSSNTNSEVTNQDWLYGADNNTGWKQGSYTAGGNTIRYDFQRAPGFFDVVCYTGTGSARTVAHNLTVVPELMIVKSRNAARSWYVYAAPQGQQFGRLDQDVQFFADTSIWNNTSPTSSVFSLGASVASNNNGTTMVAYLFATLAGVSKVGSYTGTGTTQQINCGFTGGARFVMIKRTDSTGDWYVWDSARGIVAGNDPYLLLNSFAAEVTSTDWVDTAATGFEISNAGGNLVNTNGSSYIFLAIA